MNCEPAHPTNKGIPVLAPSNATPTRTCIDCLDDLTETLNKIMDMVFSLNVTVGGEQLNTPEWVEAKNLLSHMAHNAQKADYISECIRRIIGVIGG